jgi:hypothetical protein
MPSFKSILATIGAISLAAVVGLAGYLTYSLTIGNQNEVDRATPDTVSFVLENADIPANMLQKVLHSYVSRRSGPGDHLDAYAIQLSSIDINVLAQNTARHGAWFRGDKLPQVIKDTVEFVASHQSEIEWLPSASEIQSEKYYVMPQFISIVGLRPYSARVILMNPKERLLILIDAKT